MPRHRRSSARGSVPERSLSDPILLELVKNALDTIVDEDGGSPLVRTAYSNNLKNAMDMSCALCDAEGRPHRPRGLTLPLHLGLHPRRDGPRCGRSSPAASTPATSSS